MGPVLIIGGGVGGLGAALALTAAGYDAAVYEAHPRTGEDIGAFLTLASNGMRALAAFGAAEAVAGRGFELTELRVLDSSGAELGLVPLSGHEHPLTRYRCLRRADLCAALHAEAVRRGIPIHHDTRLTGVTEDEAGVTATFADGRTERGALLVGADGLHSITRTLLDPGVAAPRYAGQRVYYGYTTDHPSRPLPRITMIRGSTVAFGYAVSPAGETYWFARVPSPGPESNPEGAAEGAAEGVAESAPEGDRGVDRDDLIARLRPDATPAADIVAATPAPMMTLARDLPEVPNWGNARTLLIGDAAHAASPATGQGASMALEDAVILAKSLRDRPTLQESLETYELLRRPRVDNNIAVSARLTAGRPQPPTRPSFPQEDQAVIHLLDWESPLPTET